MEEAKTKFAQNLTRLRKKAGETQRDLGDVLGISDKTVSKWETGESEPGLDLVVTLAKRYGVSADSLLAGEPDIEDPYAGMGSRAAALAYFGDTVGRTFTFATGRLYPTGTDPEGEEGKPLVPPLWVLWRGNRGERTGVTTSEIFSTYLTISSSCSSRCSRTRCSSGSTLGLSDRSRKRASIAITSTTTIRPM